MIKTIVSLFNQFRGLLAALLLVGVVIFLAPVPIAHGATYTVTVTNDEFNSDSDCSLREALYAANFNVATSGCPAGSANGSDTIVLADGQTYTLFRAGSDNNGVNGDLDIVDNNASFDLLIYVANGGTANIHQNANPDDRIFDIWGTQTNVMIIGVTMRYGVVSTGGGALVNEGRTTLSNVRILANQAGGNGGGIYNIGRLTIRGGSLIEANLAGNWGGGVYSSHYLSIMEDSTISYNGALTGGGVFNFGEAHIDNSTIISNSAERAGGVFHSSFYYTLEIGNQTHLIDNYASIQGGGLEVAAGTVTITNAEFFENIAPSGSAIFNQQNGGPISMSGSCIRGNNNVAVVNNASTTMTATGNWWGSSSGPGPVGPGSGDRISTLVSYGSWLTARPSFCSP